MTRPPDQSHRTPSQRRSGAQSDAGPGFSARQWWLLAAITVVAAGLRLLHLDAWSFWVDEAHTWRDATMDPKGLLASDRKWYSLTFFGLRWLLDAGWIGTGEGWLRLPFAAAGIASVPLVAVCGRRLVGVPAALLAAGFCAIDPWHVYWSQNARGYVLAFLCATLAAHAAGRWCAGGRLRHLAAACAAIAIGAACHPTTALQAVALAVFALGRRYAHVRGRVLLAGGVAIVLVLVALPHAIAWWSPFQGFLQSKRDADPLHLLQTTAYYFRPVLLVAAVTGLVLARTIVGRERALLLGCLFAVPFAVLLVVGSTIAKTTARYAICALPIVLWLGAMLCVQLWAALVPKLPRRALAPRVAALALPVLVAADLVVYDFFYHSTQRGDRAQWREACAFVQQAAPGGRLRAVTVAMPTVLYYLRPRHWSTAATDNAYPGVQVHQLTSWALQGEEEDKARVHPPGGRGHVRWHLDAGRRDGALVAFLVTLPELREIDADGSLWRALHDECDLALYLPCAVGPKDESIYVFTAPGP
jgi:hypothetical protein